MGEINLADKYSQKVSERFKQKSVTESVVNQDYEFEGVKKVKIYSFDVPELNDYNRSATANRYGTPHELGDTTQEWELTQEKSFTYVIDRGNQIDQFNLKQAGKTLRDTIDRVITPYIDKYRINKLENGSIFNYSVNSEITKSNAYDNFLKGVEALGNASVPMTDLYCIASYGYYRKIKQDDSYVKASDKGQDKVDTKILGYIEDTPLILAPKRYLANGTNFILVHKSVMCSPIKLAEYRILTGQQGYGGNVVEGRVYFDAFIDENRQEGIYLNTEASKPTGFIGAGI